MAALALSAELAEVHVVFHVAGRALAPEFDLARRLTMAVRALQLRMRSVQRKAGHACMIEFPDIPTIRRMAVVAFLAEASLVFVRGLMAADTFRRRVFVGRRQMALFARYDDVLPHKWEVSEVVIEAHIGAPAFHAVTVLALTPQPAGVHVACLMTDVTVCSKLLGRDVRGMA